MEARRDTAYVLAVGTAAALVLMVDLVHSPPRDALLEPAWTFAAYLVLPLVAVVFIDAKRTASVLALGVVGALAVLVPVIHWAYLAPKGFYKAQPLWFIVPTAIATLLLLLAVRRGGVDPDRWGLGAGDWRWWLPLFVLLFALVVPMVAGAARISPQLLAFYPEYEPARTSAVELAKYQLGNGVYMFGWEFFFRGFLLFGVARVSGWSPAVILQALLFLVLHRSKPELEMIGSFFGAVLLGYVCLRARSFWPAALLHWGMNAMMEVLGFLWRLGAS